MKERLRVEREREREAEAERDLLVERVTPSGAPSSDGAIKIDQCSPTGQ